MDERSIKMALKAVEESAAKQAKLAVKRAMRKNASQDDEQPIIPQQTGPTMAELWLKRLEDNIRNCKSPQLALNAIEELIQIEKNKLTEKKEPKNVLLG
jgi:hypothetical protein